MFSGGADVNDFTTAADGRDARRSATCIEAIEQGHEDVRRGDRRQRAGRRLRAVARVRLPRRDGEVARRPAGDQAGPAAGRRRNAAAAAPDRRERRAADDAQGRHRQSARRAKAKGILDEVVDGDVVEAAKNYAGKPKRRISQTQGGAGRRQPGLFATPFVVAQAHMMVPPEENGGFAAHKLIDAVQAAIELPFERGWARELRLFMELVQFAAVGGAAPRVLRRARAVESPRACRRPSRSRSRPPASSAPARWAPGSRSCSPRPASR